MPASPTAQAACGNHPSHNTQHNISPDKALEETMSNAAVLTPDGYFLCASNPAATTDQRDIEALALKLLQTPVIQAGRQQAVARWKMSMGKGVPDEAWARFDNFVDEWVLSCVLKGINSDANYPRVMGQIIAPPHEWLGNKMPGSRGGGGDNPDNNYVLVPVDPYAHFEFSGQRFANPPADCPMVITGDVSLASTMAVLDWQDVEFKPDGSFTVTIGPEPANGRRNHLQTKLEARYLFLRECRSDWRQTSNAYRIKRLDPPAAPPMTEAQMADRAVQFMIIEVPATHIIIRMFEGIPPNFVMPAFNTGAVGGLVTQMISFGRARIADDEAFVVTTTSGGAKYRGLVMGDPVWLISLDSWSRSGSANVGYSDVNSDGTTTFVVAKTDPGVANWLDTGGFNEVALFHRWQGLPTTPDSVPASIKGELVKLKDLDKVLPKETRRVAPAERKLQFAARTESFKLRHIDR
jgi:hypothetical protein